MKISRLFSSPSGVGRNKRKIGPTSSNKKIFEEKAKKDERMGRGGGSIRRGNGEWG